MTERLKVVTVVGTRPEIIRLAATIKLLDQHTNHVLVHTGQNYDYMLNEVFFDDLGLRKPDYFLNVAADSLGKTLANILERTERVLNETKPDAFLILGDTNSSISAVIAKRMKIPVFHMEAGNRCFDENVPEETNRRLVDHIADYNLVYTEHARRNLLLEGIHPSRIIVTGSPLTEVLAQSMADILRSEILDKQSLEHGNYFLASVHREENIENPVALNGILTSLVALKQEHGIPVLMSTHPRTRKNILLQPEQLKSEILFHEPFGFNDYNKLQMSARLVLSDSGTVSEESSILSFKALTMRAQIERPEALDTGAIIAAGTNPDSVLRAADYILRTDLSPASRPQDYCISNTADRVVRFILGSAPSHAQRANLRS